MKRKRKNDLEQGETFQKFQIPSGESTMIWKTGSGIEPLRAVEERTMINDYLTENPQALMKPHSTRPELETISENDDGSTQYITPHRSPQGSDTSVRTSESSSEGFDDVTNSRQHILLK